jgi:hypothetical protein
VSAPLSIDELKAWQCGAGLCDVHVVHLGLNGFTLAHTDTERASSEPLESCELHEWLTSLGDPPVEPGIYVAIRHEPDAYSEPYGADPWDFEPAPVAPASREQEAADV